MARAAGAAPSGWWIDRMREEDLAAVVAIERSSFLTPWPRGAFVEEIGSNRHARCLVLRETARGAATPPPRGYICYWILGEELLINNLAVDAASRRRGYARALMRHALEEACRARCRVAWLEVRPSNEAAIRLYTALGFVVAGRRRRYYSDTGEDALVMRASLKGPETA